MIQLSKLTFEIFILFSFLLLIINSKLISDKSYLVPLIIATLLPILPLLVSIITDTTSLILLIIIKTTSALAVIAIYSHRFFNKANRAIFDHIKLYWVYITGLVTLVSFIFKVHHWPYQDEIEMIGIVATCILISYFYYDGYNKGYLFAKT